MRPSTALIMCRSGLDLDLSFFVHFACQLSGIPRLNHSQALHFPSLQFLPHMSHNMLYAPELRTVTGMLVFFA